MSEVKLCKDCKHIRPSKREPDGVFGEWSKCAYPPLLSLVTGEPREFCDITRLIGRCGKEGKYWEQK